MGRLLRAPLFAAGLMAAPLITVPGQQVGSIAGTVTVANSNEPLFGVTLQIEGTQLGATTTAAGTYRIPNVPVGTHTLSAPWLCIT